MSEEEGEASLYQFFPIYGISQVQTAVNSLNLAASKADEVTSKIYRDIF